MYWLQSLHDKPLQLDSYLPPGRRCTPSKMTRLLQTCLRPKCCSFHDRLDGNSKKVSRMVRPAACL